MGLSLGKSTRCCRTSIIFIGDYRNQETIQILIEFINKYSKYYDICVTGYNFSYINNIELVRENASISGMNQARHFYDKYTAEYVIITTPAPRFIRTKRTQQIIYVLPDFNEKTFAGCIGSISQIVTSNKSSRSRLSATFPHIDIALYEGASPLERAQSIVDNLLIRNSTPHARKQYLLVTGENNFGIAKDLSGSGKYLKKLADKSYNNIIALSNGGGIGCMSASITFKSATVAKSIIEGFNGTVVFDSDEMQLLFNQFVRDNNISLKTDRFIMLPDLALMDLAEETCETALITCNSKMSAHEKYIRIIDKIYQQNSCNHYKVSVIICRYNTPLDMLSRAVESALNCGHDNVEVIVVDDGSTTSVEKELLEHFNDGRILYYYKENEGLGLSRNFGVCKATGDYVFYLDSDDTIHPKGMTRLVAHASYYHLDLVIGRRILCDENGRPFGESFGFLSGDCFRCYYSGMDIASVYQDVMVNNLLIRREALLRNEIWFTKGLYEDVEYSAKLYSSISEFHYTSVVIHDWYQYRNRNTLSSTVELENIKERVEKEESAWESIPEKIRYSRVRTALQNDFNLYLNGYFEFNEVDRISVWNLLKGFANGKKQYIDLEVFPERVKELTKSLIAGSKEYFEYVVSRYYKPETNKTCSYDNYIVLTHYHLLVACIYAIKHNRKARLFLCQSYVPFDTNLVYNIKNTGLFESVTTFVYGNVVGTLFDEIKSRPGEEDIVIPNCLYGRFAEVFRECNTRNDTFYIYSDVLPYWYYIERECCNIIKLEDAYNSFDREIKTLELKGVWAGIQKYEGSLFPVMHMKSDKIRKIIVSKNIENIPDEYANRIVVQDTKQLERDYHELIKSTILAIYSVDCSQFSPDATMLITQPLTDLGYCSIKEQKALMKAMCAPYADSKLLIKPHPADRMDYSFLKGSVLPKNVPIEAYNYMDIGISRVITFGSSAIETVEFAEEKVTYFKLHDFEFDDVVAAIKEITASTQSETKDKARPSLKQKVLRRIKRIRRPS